MKKKTRKIGAPPSPLSAISPPQAPAPHETMGTNTTRKAQATSGPPCLSEQLASNNWHCRQERCTSLFFRPTDRRSTGTYRGCILRGEPLLLAYVDSIAIYLAVPWGKVYAPHLSLPAPFDGSWRYCWRTFAPPYTDTWHCCLGRCTHPIFSPPDRGTRRMGRCLLLAWIVFITVGCCFVAKSIFLT